MKILMSGSSGFVGSALINSLFTKGHHLHTLKRNRSFSQKSDNFWDTASLENLSDGGFQAVIHLAGENISDRWSASKKKAIYESRINGTRSLVNFLADQPWKPDVLLSASAIGYYGNRGQEFLSDKSSPGTGFLAKVCQQWEAEAKRLEQWGVRVVHLRFGMILDPTGGALQTMIPLFRKKQGGVLGNGQQSISWISLYDVVEIVDFLLHNPQIYGAVNITSPNSVNNREFTRILAKELGVPAIFKLPGFMVKIILGEMGKELLLSSTRAMPRVLKQNGYDFKDTDLAKTLRHCIEEFSKNG